MEGTSDRGHQHVAGHCCHRPSLSLWPEHRTHSRSRLPPTPGGKGRPQPRPPGPKCRLPSCPQLTLLVVQVSILYYGGHLVISGQMSSGNLISFIIYEFVLGDCMEVRGWVGRGSRGGAGCVGKRALNRGRQGLRDLSKVGRGEIITVLGC